jgi:cob(I)alamin adenosyltransferase
VKIYTNTGDKGRTGLFSGERVSKADARVEAYGDVDELNSVLGALVSRLSRGESSEITAAKQSVAELQQIQSDLFCIGGWLATSPDAPTFDDLPDFGTEAVSRLEKSIDGMEQELRPINGFILPGGHATASWAHLARTVCRRTERHVIALVEGIENEAGNEKLSLAVTYLNRLSDYLFVLARYCNHLHGVSDIYWEAP